MSSTHKGKTKLDLELKKFESFLLENNIWFQKNLNLKYETYFKTGGNVKIFCCPKNQTDFITTINYIRSEKLNFKVLGYTSNTLLFDEIEYSIILSTKNLVNLKIKKDIVEVDAGYYLYDFVRVVSVLNEASGYEGLEGIPGSVGGAIFMNAAAYGDSISDNLIDVKILNNSGKVITLNKEECLFRYRDSIFKNKNNNCIILSARFLLIKGDIKTIEKKIEAVHIARHSYQEFVYPNLGSMISINQDIYLEILKNTLVGKFKYFVLKLLLKNKFIKLLKRKKPDNIAFNKLLTDYIGVSPNKVSKKSVNILLNSSTSNSSSILNYIDYIKKHINKKYNQENELVVGPAYKIDESFKKTLFNLKKKKFVK